MKTDFGYKINILFVLMVFLVCTTGFSQYDSLLHGGDNRTYLVHLPSGYSSTTDIPLVIALHGGFGNAYNMQTQSQLSTKADVENFIVVYPEGVKGGVLNVSSWNAGWCCGYASSSNVDDVGFINTLLDTLIANYAIDENRIYVTGMSNGGFMSYRLACELSDRIAAIAPVAASMSINNCTPQRAVPIISFHSYLDTHVPHGGGVGSGPSNHYNSPQDSILNKWSAINGCVMERDTLTNNNQYTEVRWDGCNCGIEMYQVITEDGGHSWPGGQKLLGDPVSTYINASDRMWDFFSAHTLICDSTISSIKKSSKNKRIKFVPNPTNGMINILMDRQYQEIGITVFSIEGKVLMYLDNERTLDLSEFEDGMFFIRVSVEGDSQMYRIYKNQ